MTDIVYIPCLETYGVVERYWYDNSMAFVTPIDSEYGRWFLPCELEPVKDKQDYYAALWAAAEDRLDG